MSDGIQCPIPVFPVCSRAGAHAPPSPRYAREPGPMHPRRSGMQPSRDPCTLGYIVLTLNARNPKSEPMDPGSKAYREDAGGLPKQRWKGSILERPAILNLRGLWLQFSELAPRPYDLFPPAVPAFPGDYIATSRGIFTPHFSVSYPSLANRLPVFTTACQSLADVLFSNSPPG